MGALADHRVCGAAPARRLDWTGQVCLGEGRGEGGWSGALTHPQGAIAVPPSSDRPHPPASRGCGPSFDDGGQVPGRLPLPPCGAEGLVLSLEPVCGSLLLSALLFSILAQPDGTPPSPWFATRG